MKAIYLASIACAALIWSTSDQSSFFNHLFLDKPQERPVLQISHVDIETCDNTPDLVSIDIDKDNFIRGEKESFRFFAKLINPKVEPSELMYRWVVRAPAGSKISSEPVETLRLNLEPDVWGTYHIILTLGDKTNQCRHGIYVFNYPEIDPKKQVLPLILQASLML